MPARGRHAKPSRLRTITQTAGLSTAVALPLSALAAAPAAAASPTDFARLRACESGGNYRINTGNGYYGAYQFDLATWRSVGFSGRPDLASRATQDEAARRLQAARGWSPWPACSRKLALGSSSAAPARTSSVAVRTARTATSASRSSTAAAPAFPAGKVIRAERGRYRPEVRAWQARMAQRGWRIAIDGYCGPQSSSVAASFAAEKGLRTARRGDLNRAVFTGAWTLRVT